ncbi:MAG: hypothetical protein NC323_05400 [Oxalobacter formigenes]|nr:hypothetical protein [Oxalobacter formigenes]
MTDGIGAMASGQTGVFPAGGFPQVEQGWGEKAMTAVTDRLEQAGIVEAGN